MPVQTPATIFGRNIAFSASDPQSSSASIAPCVSSGHSANAMLAPCHISSTAVASSCGRPCPPCSGFLVRPFQPFSAKRRYASLKPAGVLTAAAFLPLRAFAVAGGVQRIEHLGGELCCLFEDRVDGVRRRVLEAWQLGDLVEAGELAQDEADLGSGA